MSMNVTPMSMQMIVPQATEAGNVQHNLNQANMLQQNFDAVEQKAADRLKEQQVQHKDNPEDGRIKDDTDREKGRGGSKKRQNRQSAIEEEEIAEENFAADPNRGHLLDISL